MSFTMILDILVALLLIPTIAFAVILNNRLLVLRKNREELGRLIAAFNDATVRAESGIPRLKRTSEEASKALREKVEKAQILRDDLAFMIERADQMSGRLEGALRDARDMPLPEARTAPRASRLVPLPRGMDIESAAEAAERAALAIAKTQQEPRIGMGEWTPAERHAADRARAQVRHVSHREEASPRSVPLRSGTGRIPPVDLPAKARSPARRGLPVGTGLSDGGVGSAGHALAEHILKEQAALGGDRLDGTAPPHSLTHAGERGRQSKDPAPVAAPGQGGRPPPAKSVRSTRSGQVLGAALADEPVRTVERPAPPAHNTAPPSSQDDDERSETERELLRALRSVR